MNWLRLPALLTVIAICNSNLATSRADQIQSTPTLSPRELIQKGSDQFLTGKIHDSIKTFEAAIKSRPEVKPYLWQLGIAYYYVERYADGRDLFELHQTVNQNDVENAVWHFLCLTRLEGAENARKKLIPITGDSRVPMKEIHALFAGTGTQDQVLAAAESISDVSKRRNSLCYAYLYLSLFHEAQGHSTQSRDHILKAAREYRQDHYMGKVALIHANLRGVPDLENPKNP